MTRFQCANCNRRHRSGIACPNCGTAARQVQLCRAHGARHVHRCPACRTLARSQSGI
ncbi:hypothetical protein [Sphaerisporangium aureirubrum]|uniref:Small CPxCG-related zinc finger protein n=1 Tax=Sphaerisporangium aureirubrum TaxID=1544736 RepID=A0ABW1NE92_9ACTN